MAGRAWTPEMEAWLAEAYPTEHEGWIVAELARRFGREVSVPALRTKAWRMGLAKAPRTVPEHAARRVRWSVEPEMDAWMRGHDTGQSPSLLSRQFGARFGFPLSRAQVGLWRSSNGRSGPSHGGGRPLLPVGSERDTGKGYVLVKVAERAAVPQSKDNWVPKQVLAWERENGPLPDGHVILFADRDHGNLDPENLVAVPKRLVGLLNGPSSPGWRDAGTLRAAMAWCELHSGLCAAEAERPRRCGVCGREFTPPPESRHDARRLVRTCPECLAAGRKAPASARGAVAVRTCAVCGREFGATRANQRRCPECIARHPKWSAELQAHLERRR